MVRLLPIMAILAGCGFSDPQYSRADGEMTYVCYAGPLTEQLVTVKWSDGGKTGEAVVNGKNYVFRFDRSDLMSEYFVGTQVRVTLDPELIFEPTSGERSTCNPGSPAGTTAD